MEGYDGSVVIGGGGALNPLFGERVMGEEDGTHVAEEEDVEVEIEAAVEVEGDEADGVGDLDGGKGGEGGGKD